MAVDAELISSEGFNLKFKNYLRDFFIYQFKERGSDFKVKGTNDKTNVNKDIIDGTFYPDAKRLQFAMEQAAGVTWSKGDFVDLPKGRINKKRENKRVECITIDSRRIENNPFFALYQLCSESALTPGTHFSFVYTILLYFQLGKIVRRTDCAKLSEKEIKNLNEYLITLAEDIESEMRRHKPKSWKEFSDEDKEKFALEAIDRFSKDHFGLEEIYNHMILNKMKIVYADGHFVLQNDDSAFIEKNILFDVLSQYGIEVDDKQFGNKMLELTRLGIVKSEKRGQRIYYSLSDVFLSGIIGEDEDFSNRFSDCIAFFAQTSPLGEIGTYIQNRLPKCNAGAMRFKHNYIKRALNDYNNIDLLYAIKNNLCAIIEYRNASLRTKYFNKKTFDNFIVSRSNVEAYSACVDLVNDPKGKLVAIYGANSYGKSHLLYAIKNALVEGHSDLSIRFTNYDDVISQYITSLHNREHKAFVEELLETDILIMDNMQFIGGKEATQDEVADWINKLVEAGKSVVIAFDRPIKYFSPLLRGVEERHPDGCTVAEVKRPDRFLRKKYIEFLLTEYPVILPHFLKGYIIISRRMPFSALTGFVHKCSLLEKQKGRALSPRELRECLSGYMHKEV